MPFFMYHRSSRPTGRVLALALGMAHGASYDDRADLLIRWGAQASLPYRARNVLNHTTALARASDKYGSLVMMRETGVPVPNHDENPAMLTPPFLGRERSHTRGQDIVLCMQLGDAIRAESDYFVEYVPTDREYRIHVFDGKVIYLREKRLTNEAAFCPWIRNYATGYTFHRPSVAPGAIQEAAAIQAVAAHGLVFGAVDLIVGQDGQTYVLEVNTAPACSPATGKAYVDAIANYCSELGFALSPDYSILEELRNDDEEGES